jgi:hypothetical protein
MSSGLTWSERANWGLLIGGGAMELVAVLFVVIESQVAEIRLTFIVTGVIMAASGLLLLRMGWGSDDAGADDRRIRENGIAGRATVVAVRPTGVVVKNRPQVSLPGVVPTRCGRARLHRCGLRSRIGTCSRWVPTRPHDPIPLRTSEPHAGRCP